MILLENYIIIKHP